MGKRGAVLLAVAEEVVSELVTHHAARTIMCERAVYPDLVPFDNGSTTE